MVDLGYGDAGKGTTVDWLCRDNPDVETVIRFSGGAQAAHNVVCPDGRHHTFAQFGSGTFAGANTYLSQYMLVNLLALESEAERLAALGINNPLSRISIHADALLITPYHIAYNQELERLRGANRHGSCGQGIGTTQKYALDHPDEAPRFKDLVDGSASYKFELLAEWLRELGLEIEGREKLLAHLQAIASRIKVEEDPSELLDRAPCVFEGSQGVLLDEWWGFHPHTTWSTTTFDNALDLLAGREAKKLGVTRTYSVRHGDGPMPSEDPALDAAHPELHNQWGTWMGGFRVGHFDTVAMRYAIEVCGGVDALAITHADHPPVDLHIAHYTLETDHVSAVGERLHVGEKYDLEQRARLTTTLFKTTSFGAGKKATPAAIAAALNLPIEVTSHGPTHKNKVRQV